MAWALVALRAQGASDEHLAVHTLNPSGITVIVRDPTNSIITPVLRAKQDLYRFKKDSADWTHLKIFLSPDDPDNRLWIVNDPQDILHSPSTLALVSEKKSEDPDSSVIEVEF